MDDIKVTSDTSRVTLDGASVETLNASVETSDVDKTLEISSENLADDSVIDDEEVPSTDSPVIFGEISFQPLNASVELNDVGNVKVEEIPKISSGMSADDSIICLDEEEDDYSLPDLPIQIPSINSTDKADKENDDDFSIVYEKITPTPEVQVIVNCYATTKSRAKKSTRSSREQSQLLHSESNSNENRIEEINENRSSLSHDADYLDDSVSIIEDDSVPVLAASVSPSRTNLYRSPRKAAAARHSLLDSAEKKKRKIECGVCFDGPDEISKSGRNVVSTVCGHIFCCQCVKMAIKSCKQCPQCRKRLNTKQFHPIYV